MTLALRSKYPSALCHVSAWGNTHQRTYLDAKNIQEFLELLSKRYHLLCHAYCLMDNQFRLPLETPDGNLAVGMG